LIIYKHIRTYICVHTCLHTRTHTHVHRCKAAKRRVSFDCDDVGLRCGPVGVVQTRAPTRVRPRDPDPGPAGSWEGRGGERVEQAQDQKTLSVFRRGPRPPRDCAKSIHNGHRRHSRTRVTTCILNCERAWCYTSPEFCASRVLRLIVIYTYNDILVDRLEFARTLLNSAQKIRMTLRLTRDIRGGKSAQYFFIHTHTRTDIHTCTHTCAHTHTHTHIIYIYIYIYIYIPFFFFSAAFSRHA